MLAFSALGSSLGKLSIATPKSTISPAFSNQSQRGTRRHRHRHRASGTRKTCISQFVTERLREEVLDDGETDGTVLANALAVDGFLTDDFGGTDFPLIHAVLRGPRIVPTPRLIVEYARNGHLSHEAARTLITTISPHRSWENSPYVTQLLQRLDV